MVRMVPECECREPVGFQGWQRIQNLKSLAQESVGFGASKAKTAGFTKIGPGEDSFCRVCSLIARLWGKKTVFSKSGEANGPLRPICSRRFPSPTGS